MNLSEVCAELEEHLELLKGWVGRGSPVNDGADLGSLQYVAELGDVLLIVVRKHLELLILHGELLCSSSGIGGTQLLHFVRLKHRVKEMLP